MARIRRAPSEPEWLDVGHGVHLQCHLFDPAADMAAGRAAIDAIRQIDAGKDPDLEETVALARRAVVGWKGVEAADGSPLPFDVAELEIMLRNGIVDDEGKAHMVVLSFTFAFRIARDKWRAEGEGYAVALPGTSSATAVVPSAPAVLQ
jgi:hypothetical protein